MPSRSERIDDAVSKWHEQKPGSVAVEVPLYTYLGWTWEEYKHWVVTCEPPAEREGAL